MKIKRLMQLCAFALSLVLLLPGCGTGAVPGKTAGATEELQDWQSQYDLGVRYLNEGNYEEAIIAFSAAIEIDPKLAPAYVGRGDAHVALMDQTAGAETRLEHYQSAVADYTSCLELDEQQAEVYLKLAQAHLLQGDRESAMSVLLKGYSITGDDAIMAQLQELGFIPDDTVVEWSDPTLERMLREKLGKPEGDILVQDLDSITSLSIYGDTYCFINNEGSDQMSWRSINGGELVAFYTHDDGNDQFTKYTSRGSLANIDSLRYFRNLNQVHIIANQITDISALNSMHLSGACLWANDISDLSPLEGIGNDYTAQLNQEQFVQLGDNLPTD